jgi:hypothetical protein
MAKKEQFAGFYLIEAADMNSAVAIASKIPPAQIGSIEVRPVRELVNTSGQRRQDGLNAPDSRLQIPNGLHIPKYGDESLEIISIRIFIFEA